MLILGLLAGCAAVPGGGVGSAELAGSLGSGRQVQAVADEAPAASAEVRAVVIDAAPGQVHVAPGQVTDGTAGVSTEVAAP